MTFNKQYYPYEHFDGGSSQMITTSQESLQKSEDASNQKQHNMMSAMAKNVKYTTMKLDNNIKKGVTALGNKTREQINSSNTTLAQYIDNLDDTLQKNAQNMYLESKALRNNQQTLLNQANTIDVKSNYYNTKQKQNTYNVEKNIYRQNIFRLLLGLNIILLCVILFIINKAK